MVNEQALIPNFADPFGSEMDTDMDMDTNFVTALRSNHSTDRDSSDLDSEPADDPPLAPLVPPPLDNPQNVDNVRDQHNQICTQCNRAPPMWIQSGDWDTEKLGFLKVVLNISIIQTATFSYTVRSSYLCISNMS